MACLIYSQFPGGHVAVMKHPIALTDQDNFIPEKFHAPVIAHRRVFCLWPVAVLPQEG